MRRLARLRVVGIEDVVLDEHAADAAELLPLFDEFVARIEDLDADVATVGNDETSALVEHHRVRGPELAWPRTQLAEAPNEFAVFRENRNASDSARRRRRILTAVALRDQDVAVGREDDVAWFVERLRRIARCATLSDRHQDLAVR